MRIVAGAFRGRRLSALGKGDAGAHLRPTTDRTRESLFNILSHLDVIEGCHVLDMFAGTGALGLEALSRGATHVTFVENGRVGAGLIRDNIRLLGCMDATALLRTDARRLPECSGEPAGLVFLDPPYGQSLGAPALMAAQARGWLASKACIVWEESAPQLAPEGFRELDQRWYGETCVTILEAAQ